MNFNQINIDEGLSG